MVQAQPSASEDAIAQSLREEHELIASFVKRTQEMEIDDKRSESVGTQVASVAPPPLFVADSRPCLSHDRRPPQKAVTRVAPKAAARKRFPPAEALALEPAPPAIVSETPPFLDSLPPPAQFESESRARPIIRFAGAVLEWVADVAQAPGRVAFLSRLPDWPSMPPLIRPLAFFRQN